MHKLIRVLVFAPDEDVALNEARKVVLEVYKNTRKIELSDFSGDQNDESNPSRLAQGRWGPIPPALQVSTARFPTEDARGLEQVMEAFELIKTEFKENMRWMRYHIANYTNDELFETGEKIFGNGKGFVMVDGVKLYDDPSNLRSVCECLSGSNLGDAFLFEFCGGWITNHYHLHRILTDSDDYPFYTDETGGQDPEWGDHIWKQPLWVVPFNLRFE